MIGAPVAGEIGSSAHARSTTRSADMITSRSLSIAIAVLITLVPIAFVAAQ